MPESVKIDVMENRVMRMSELEVQTIAVLFLDYALHFQHIAGQQPIPGSFWGEPEAGLIAHTLYYRDDTPVHSVLHEACHFVCMNDARRAVLHTNAGGTHAEESAVCYLQIVLADKIPALGRARLMADMDTWGYSFRLGSARRWFEEDTEDARLWLTDNLTNFNKLAHRLPASTDTAVT